MIPRVTEKRGGSNFLNWRDEGGLGTLKWLTCIMGVTLKLKIILMMVSLLMIRKLLINLIIFSHLLGILWLVNLVMQIVSLLKITLSKSDSKFQFDIITDDYVFDQICNLSNNKSPGLDGFQAKLLKLAAPTICKLLAYICNLSLLTSTFPSDWKQAKVYPYL